MDWSALDSNDPHTIQIALEQAKAGDPEAARRLLKCFARSLRTGQWNRDLFVFYAEAMDAIADSDVPADRCAKKLCLVRPGRGRPRDSHAAGKSVRAEAEMGSRVGPKVTASRASGPVADIVNKESNRVRDDFRLVPDRERRAQMAMNAVHRAGAVEQPPIRPTDEKNSGN